MSITQEALFELVSTAVKDALATQTTRPKEWLTLKEAAHYLGVCINTFNKFRQNGLQIVEIEGTKRVSVTEINRFMNTHIQ